MKDMPKKNKNKPSEMADHRVQFLRSLDEESFRQVVLIPLFVRLGYREVIEYHGGSPEKGKDIICWYADPMENRRYVALVVKRGDIHGSVSKRGSASEILFQIQQALNEPYRDIYGLNQIRINECVIVTTGNIKNTAIESISESLRASNMDRFLRFIDGARIIDLITRHMPEYWISDQSYLLMLHEMRATLSSISNSASMLKHYQKKIDEKKMDKVVNRIAADAEIAHQLAETQYLYGLKETRVHPSVTAVEPVLKEIVSYFHRILGSRMNHKVKLKIDGNLDSALIDSKAFRQAMFNILDNAAKYSHRNQAIQVIACHNGPQIIIRVQNNGPGISSNFEELIFQPFFSASPHGPGLGLYVARKLLAAMDVDIRVTKRSDPMEISVYLKRQI